MSERNYVPDYLEQKKIRNYAQVQKAEVQGKHQPIVTETEYLRVQKMLDSKKASQVAIERARC
ncbi:MAG: recombinase family protein [Herbinix sp.]|nr:recombinase family protein [Herbinix sp.]